MTGRPVVAIVTDSVYPFFHGGKEQRYREVLNRLSRDCDVRVFTMKWWAGDGALRLGDIEYIAICPKVNLYVGGRRSLLEAAVFGLASVRLAAARFDAVEADHIPYAPLFVLRAICTVRRKRFVVTWHEVWGKDLWCEYLGDRLGRLAWWVERGSMLMPDRIIAASPQTADRLRPFTRNRTVIDVAPNGLDLDLIRRAPPQAERSDLVFVGRLLPHKHADLLLEAMGLLTEDGQRLTCRIVGVGPELPRLRALTAQLGLEDAVEFLDEVEEQESVYSLMKSAEIFVFPSVREGFGIAVLEALACGLPVVTTSAPDNHAQALVERTGRGIICPPTAADVARGILTVKDSMPGPGASLDAESSHRLEALLRQYDWDTVTDVVATALGVAGD